MTEEQWSFINARASAIEALVLAIARASPQYNQIRTQLIADAEGRRKALRISPMPDDQIEAVMEPFQRLIAALSL